MLNRIILVAIALAITSTTVVGSALSSADDKEPKTVGPELIVNGSFESCTPNFDGPWYTFRAPSHDIHGWSVGLKDVDVHQSPPFQAPNGRRYVDLNGDNNGSVRQQIKTEPGATYLLSFYMSTNPDGGPTPRPMYVRAAGQTKSFSPRTSEGASRENSQWHTYSREFMARELTTTVELGSLVPTEHFGAIIDNVSVKKLNVPLKSVATKAADKLADPFPDFSSVESRLQESVRSALRQQFIDLRPDGNFQPNEPVTRADFVRWLVRIRRLPVVATVSQSFADVPPGYPDNIYIEAAAKEKLVLPVEEGDKVLFKPEEHITRQNFAEMYCTFAGKEETAEKLSDEQIEKDLHYSSSGDVSQTWKDIANIGDTERRWIAFTQRGGILSQAFDVDPAAKLDQQRMLSPEKTVTRAEAVNILMILYGQ